MRVRQNPVSRDNKVVYCSVLENPPSSALRFSHWENRSITGTNTRYKGALSIIIFYYIFYALKGFFTYRILITSGKRFCGIYLNINGMCAVNFANIS